MTVADFLWRLMRRLYILHLYKLCLFLSKRKRVERFSCTAVEINFKCSFVFQSHELSFFVFAFKTLRMPLSLKYACPSESTWKLAVSSLLKVLSIGLPVARQHASSGKFDTMWPELANAFEDFLFTKR